MKTSLAVITAFALLPACGAPYGNEQGTVSESGVKANAPAAATVDSKPHATADAPKHGDTPLHLWVSNESAASPDVDIDVYIDDVLSVTGTFHHEPFISFQGFELAVAKGTHTIRAVTKAGGIEKTSTFEIPAERWANISFYGDTTNGKQITAQVYDVPMFFD